MSPLRRDLVERRLWLVVVVLVAAVIAVPFLLHGRAHNADAAIPQPPGPTASPTVTSAPNGDDGHGTPVSTRRHTRSRVTPTQRAERHAATTRDPFAVTQTHAAKTSTKAVSKLVPENPATKSGAAVDATTTTPAATTPTATGTSGGSGETSVTAPVATAPAAPSTVTVTTTATATTTTTATPTTTSTTPLPVGSGPWDIESVDVNISGAHGAITRHDVARLTPLPSVAAPKVMFTGMLDHGRLAVFALADGVKAQGPGRCHPGHGNCAAITLAPGQIERLIYFAPDGTIVGRELQVARITHRLTHSVSAAQAAFTRFSRAGQCELDLAAPTTYDAARGALTPVAESGCRGVKGAVPFPGPVKGS
jgi:hypothetical protein